MTNLTTNHTVHIAAKDLPLYCTGPHHETWQGHPRVFLAIQDKNHIACPYCGTIYQLDGDVKTHH